MNKFDEAAEPRRCGARNHQDKMPCKRWASPFQSRCILHGGARRDQREKARRAMLDYEQWGSDPAWRKAERIERWRESERRYEMRRAKKKGPQAVAQLKAEWAADAAEKRAWREDTTRANEAERQRKRQEQERRRAPSPPPATRPYDDDGPRGFGFDLFGDTF